MDISVVRRASEATVLGLTGRLTMASAIDLRDAVAALVGAGEIALVVDMAGIESIDSAGLGGLIGAQRTVREAGGDLRIASPSSSVRAVLKATSLDRVLAPSVAARKPTASRAA